MKRTLEVAAVQIVAHQQKLLQEPDPAIAKEPLLRVPSGSGYTADDWTECWRMGAIDFEDQYALSHQGKLLSKENMKNCGDYLYVNRLDPMAARNWKIAWTRLMAAGIISQQAPAP